MFLTTFSMISRLKITFFEATFIHFSQYFEHIEETEWAIEECLKSGLPVILTIIIFNIIIIILVIDIIIIINIIIIKFIIVIKIINDKLTSQ